MKAKTPKVSIIVPCYNVATYVARCMDSLINQTIRDIEIICIDDKSTDDTLNILTKYAQRDKRIKIIKHKINTGVAVARNDGMARATGEYIGFVDPDDYVDLDFYEKLYLKAMETYADITVSNICEVLFGGTKRYFTNWLKELAANKLAFNYTLWCAIYRTDFLKYHKIDNPSGIITSQDTVFAVKCSVLAKKIAIVPDVFYHYIRVRGSLSSEYLSDEKIESKIKAANLILDFLNNQYLSKYDYCQAMMPIFNFISQYCFIRTTKRETRMRLANATVDLFNKFKYKSMLEQYAHGIYPYLVCSDPDGLYNYVLQSYTPAKTCVMHIKLFKYIPFIRIKQYTDGRIKISVFGIPVFRVILSQNRTEIKYDG